jgi:hypothetical protein
MERLQNKINEQTAKVREHENNIKKEDEEI